MNGRHGRAARYGGISSPVPWRHRGALGRFGCLRGGSGGRPMTLRPCDPATRPKTLRPWTLRPYYTKT
eukprot:8655026-Pyramimonas_sp.AAC.1